MRMSFDVVVDWCDSFGSVDLTFEHYIVTTETLINNYLIFPKMFLETVKSGNPRTVIRIDTYLL